MHLTQLGTNVTKIKLSLLTSIKPLNESAQQESCWLYLSMWKYSKTKNYNFVCHFKLEEKCHGKVLLNDPSESD